MNRKTKLIIVLSIVIILIITLTIDRVFKVNHNINLQSQTINTLTPYESIILPNQDQKNITHYFGNETSGDLNNDGKNDVAFLITQDTGGSGLFYYIAAALTKDNSYQGLNTVFLGDRIAPQTTEIKNGEIIVNYADRKLTDSFAIAPSVGVSKYFQVKDGQLVEILKFNNEENSINSVTFNCSNNKTIQAIFFKDKVELNLSDGRHMLLNQAVSASGARYANNDESFVFWNKGNSAFIDENNKTTFNSCNDNTKKDSQAATTTPNTGITNPASTNCIKLGGNLVIEKRGDGGEYGLCYFEDNRACEEWALMRGGCPYGGRRTTGFDTIDQKYCAWLGGDTFAVANSICTFKDGSKCPTKDFYNGTCPK